VTSAIVIFRIVSFSSCQFSVCNEGARADKKLDQRDSARNSEGFFAAAAGAAGRDRVKEQPFRTGRVLKFVGESVRIESAVVLLFGLPLANR
jgi:hypothetical protein